MDSEEDLQEEGPEEEVNDRIPLRQPIVRVMGLCHLVGRINDRFNLVPRRLQIVSHSIWSSTFARRPYSFVWNTIGDFA
jgi:hypothetical protein